jgi:hypothetical protein
MESRLKPRTAVMDRRAPAEGIVIAHFIKIYDNFIQYTLMNVNGLKK